MYVGLGFGTTEMSNADIIACLYYFYNKATDAFVCSDMKTDSNNNPTADSSQDIYNVSTVSPTSYTRTATTANTTNFIIKFTRPMITNDTLDYQLSNSTYDIIWSFGYIVNNQTVQHTSGNYGSASLNLTMAPYYLVNNSHAAAMIASLFTLFAAVFVLNI